MWSPWLPVPSSLGGVDAGLLRASRTAGVLSLDSLAWRPAGAEESRPGRARERCHSGVGVR